MSRYDIFVTRITNKQPAWSHLRHTRIHADKVERLMLDVINEEYEHANRGRVAIEGDGTIENHSVIMLLTLDPDTQTVIWVHAEERKR